MNVMTYLFLLNITHNSSVTNFFYNFTSNLIIEYVNVLIHFLQDFYRSFSATHRLTAQVGQNAHVH